jgi:ribosome-associated heat shock protein Hsp15|tara:strand:+ start:1471 stop:1830 length:360 start_codon:yes stop_codon:yes gene_type:complete
MRIDQFLWFSRVYKTRTTAGNACKKGHVKMNSKSLKPSSAIYPNMTISVKKNQILNIFEIKDLPKSRIGSKIVELYIKNITPVSELEKKEIIISNKRNYKFDGKPSKKDRRDLNEYLNE